MSEPLFLPRISPATLGHIIALTGAAVAECANLSQIISGVAPLDEAGPGELTFLDSSGNASQLEASCAAACFVPAAYVYLVPKLTIALVAEDPGLCFALALRQLVPQSALPSSLFATAGISPGASIHPEARLEHDVIVDPGAIIGPRAEIGSGSLIGANSVVGRDVRIGRDCIIGPQVTLAHALIGNRVTLHPGVRIGQPSVYMGHALTVLPSDGRARAPRLGRVIIQDGVEIGANAAIDRGAMRDTVIGEQTRIGDLARIADSVIIGRLCIVAAQADIPAGTRLQDNSAV